MKKTRLQRDVRRAEQKEAAKKKKKAAKAAKRKPIDENGRATDWKRIRIEREVEKLVELSKINASKS